MIVKFPVCSCLSCSQLLVFVVLIFLLVILVCKVIVSGLRIAVFLSVEAVSVYQSVRMPCREEMRYMARNGHSFLLGNSSYLGAVLNLGCKCLCSVKTLPLEPEWSWGVVLSRGKWLVCTVATNAFPQQLTHDCTPAPVSPLLLPHLQSGWSTPMFPSPSKLLSVFIAFLFLDNYCLYQPSSAGNITVSQKRFRK